MDMSFIDLLLSQNKKREKICFKALPYHTRERNLLLTYSELRGRIEKIDKDLLQTIGRERKVLEASNLIKAEKWEDEVYFRIPEWDDFISSIIELNDKLPQKAG